MSTDQQRQKQPYKTLHHVDDDDLEDATIALHIQNGVPDDKEMISFIEKYTTVTEGFHDYYLHAMRDLFGNSNSLAG
jgi:hypothetical protein